MEYGYIKDTTIQGIADGLRSVGLVAATRIEDIQRESFHYVTENVTSDTDATPAYNANNTLPNVGSLDYSPLITEMPGASSIEFVVDIGLVHPDSDNTHCGRFEIYDRNDTQIISETINKDFKGKHTYIVPGDYAKYGRNSSYVTMTGCYTAFIVDLYPLDAEGNRITYTVQEPVLNTLTPSAMVEVINNCPPPPPEDAFVFSGDMKYAFYKGNWDWFVEQNGHKITTENITSAENMFQYSNLKEIPFTLNVNGATLDLMLEYMHSLEKCPKIRGTLGTTGWYRARNCIASAYRLRDAEDLFTPEMLEYVKDIKVTSAYGGGYQIKFSYCYSLRKVPSWWKLQKLNYESTVIPNSSIAGLYRDCFMGCYTLDEVLDMPVWTCKGAATSNLFESTFHKCTRLKDITFETDNGTPIAANWKSQTITLGESYCDVGTYSNYGDEVVIGYNSGITSDKEVTDDTSYQALKDDPDYYTNNPAYSRYNHDSAVRTINSLPDTSAYLASAGGTNTIKFRGNSGSATDGGAINTLTEEEIAVATAKGWTVTLV